MFILFPYRVDVPFNHRPVANWLVVALVILVFFVQITEDNSVFSQTSDNTSMEKSITFKYMLKNLSINGLFGHIWLHGGILHFLGNLLFLWLFGNAVCSKIGNLCYLPVYIFLGMIAGFTHLLFSDQPAIGASGAINGLVGMYLVFFPENSISCFFCFLFWFWRPLWFSLRSFWMILLWFAFDIHGALKGHGGVAYFVHIGGFLAGLGLALLMLKTKMIVMERDETSILELVRLDKKEKHNLYRGDLTQWQQEWENTEIKEFEQETIHPEPIAKPEQYIFLKCRCGQRIKVPSQHAGKIGKCPRCSAKWKIPEF
ncbi:MAG: rhomboid family intramembrane serine protease [Sedimentisphaerales bacterium]|nr:rhomboid family intramembrane serine protease [Sedimentisphaerales bacterium]